MSSEASALAVDLRANVKQFEKAMQLAANQTESKLRTIEKRFETANKKLDKEALRTRTAFTSAAGGVDVGTRERLAVDLLLYTAQRSGDVRVMGRQNVKDGYVRVRQEKTRELVEVPIHPELQRSLDAAPLGQLTFVVTQAGEPFTSKGFGNWISAAAKAAGLPAGAAAHGLRKAAARRLAEAGATAHEIMAVTGHRTLKEVERYTRAAAMKGLAASAMARIASPKQEQTMSNPDDRLDKIGGK